MIGTPEGSRPEGKFRATVRTWPVGKLPAPQPFRPGARHTETSVMLLLFVEVSAVRLEPGRDLTTPPGTPMVSGVGQTAERAV